MTGEQMCHVLWDQLEEYRIYAVNNGYIDIAYGIIKAQEIIKSHIEVKTMIDSDMSECPVCGRRYIRTCEWAYKLEKKNGRLIYFCRYNCLREWEKKNETKKRRYN